MANITSAQVKEAIDQLAAMTAAASITPEAVASVMEKLRNLTDAERQQVVEVASAYLTEINTKSQEWLNRLLSTGGSADKIVTNNDSNVQSELDTLGQEREGIEGWVRYIEDAEGKFIWGITDSGDIKYGVGIPSTIKGAIEILNEPIQKINSQIYYEQSVIDLVKGSYYRMADGVGAVATNVTLAEWSHQIIEAKEGDVFYVKAFGGNSPRACGFVDSSFQILFVVESGLFEGEVIAPEGTAFLILNSVIPTAGNYIPPILLKTKSKIDDFDKAISDMKDVGAFEDSDFIKVIVDEEGKILEGVNEKGEVIHNTKHIFNGGMEGGTAETSVTNVLTAEREEYSITHENASMFTEEDGKLVTKMCEIAQGTCISVELRVDNSPIHNAKYQYQITEYSVSQNAISSSGWTSVGDYDFPMVDYRISPETAFVTVSLKLIGKTMHLADLEDSKVRIVIAKPIYNTYQEVIPSFVSVEGAKVLDRVMAWQGEDSLDFTMLSTTDTHSQRSGRDGKINGRYKSIRYAKPLAAILGADVFLHSGDFGIDQASDGISDVAQKKNDTLQQLADYGRMWGEINAQTPSLFAYGNHEYELVKNKKYATYAHLISAFTKPAKRLYPNNVTIQDTYGYYDNEESRIRVYFLNSSEGTDQGYSDRQMQFFLDSMNSVPDNYKVIISYHYIYLPNVEGFPTRQPGRNGHAIRTLIADFANHRSGSYDSWSWDFTSMSTQKIVCVIAGHCHYNIDANVDNVQWIVRQGYGLGYFPSRNLNTLTGEYIEGYETPSTIHSFNHEANVCFDLLCVKGNSAKLFRVGAGGEKEDIEFNF